MEEVKWRTMPEEEMEKLVEQLKKDEITPYELILLIVDYESRGLDFIDYNIYLKERFYGKTKS